MNLNLFNQLTIYRASWSYLICIRQLGSVSFWHTNHLDQPGRKKKRESDLINQSRDIWTWHLPETFQKVDCHTLPSHDLQRLGNSWQKTINSTIKRLQFRSFCIWKNIVFIQYVLPQVFLKLASGCQHILHFPLYIISYGQLEALKIFKCETWFNYKNFDLRDTLNLHSKAALKFG